MNITIILLTAVILILVIRIHTFKRERSSLNSTIEFLKLENSQLRNIGTRDHELYECLEQYCGGVLKRIDEIREITEVINKYSPEIFSKEHGLICWLSASDEFLTKLADVYAPHGENPYFDSKRVLFMANGRTDKIYSEIQPNNAVLKRA